MIMLTQADISNTRSDASAELLDASLQHILLVMPDPCLLSTSIGLLESTAVSPNDIPFPEHHQYLSAKDHKSYTARYKLTILVAEMIQAHPDMFVLVLDTVDVAYYRLRSDSAMRQIIFDTMTTHMNMRWKYTTCSSLVMIRRFISILHYVGLSFIPKVRLPSQVKSAMTPYHYVFASDKMITCLTPLSELYTVIPSLETFHQLLNANPHLRTSLLKELASILSFDGLELTSNTLAQHSPPSQFIDPLTEYVYQSNPELRELLTPEKLSSIIMWVRVSIVDNP